MCINWHVRINYCLRIAQCCQCSRLLGGSAGSESHSAITVDDRSDFSLWILTNLCFVLGRATVLRKKSVPVCQKFSALLKAWMEESRKQEERCQEERELSKKARLEERCQYKEQRH